MTPLVSVVVPSFNHAPYVEAMARSVLDQGVDDLELIVADDGSIDGSLEILGRLATSDARVRVLRHPGGLHRGRLPALLLGMREATGRFIAVLGSDDRWLPGKLEAQLAALESGAVLSYARARHVDPEGRTLPTSSGRSAEEIGLPAFEALCLENYIPAATAAFPLDAYRRAGGFESSQQYEDYALWLRLCALGEPVFDERVLGEYRVSRLGADARIRSLGRDLPAMHSAIDAVRLWPDLPERHRDSVESWERVYRAVTQLVSGEPAEGIRPTDAPRMTRLIQDKEGRLLELVGQEALDAWEARPMGGDRTIRPATGAPDHRVIGHIDIPIAGATVPAGTVEVEGWALDAGDRPAGILVAAGGGPDVEARLGLLRPDVAGAHPDLPGARRSGWRAEIELAEPSDRVRIDARARRANREVIPLGSTEVSVVLPGS